MRKLQILILFTVFINFLSAQDSCTSKEYGGSSSLPHGHNQSGVEKAITKRTSIVSKRLGYDY